MFTILLTSAVMVILIIMVKQAMAQSTSESIYYYHLDHLGTPIMLTDSNQAIAWDATYEPFGKATVTTATVTNNLRFPGQYYDAETGLHYNWHRYYWPEVGRHVEADIVNIGMIELPFNFTNTLYKNTSEYGNGWILIIHPEVQHVYLYSTNNPQIWSDPAGLTGREPKRPNPNPAPGGCIQCARELRKEGFNRFPSINETQEINFMRHCWGVCEICRRCPFGPICSGIGGWYNELEGSFSLGRYSD